MKRARTMEGIVHSLRINGYIGMISAREGWTVRLPDWSLLELCLYDLEASIGKF